MIRFGGLPLAKISNLSSGNGRLSNHTSLGSNCGIDNYAKYLGLVLIFLFITLGVLGNSLVATVLLCTRRLLPTSTTFFIINLAISDLLTCLTVLPFDVVYWLHFPEWKLQPALCKLWNSLFYTFHTSSSLFVVAISADTYITVATPLHRPSRCKKAKTLIVICTIWVWSLAIGSLIYIFQKNPPPGEYLFDINAIAYGSYLVVHMILSQIAASYYYFKLFRIARFHAISIKSLQVSEVSENNSNNTQSLDGLNFKEEITLAKTFLMVTVAYFLCWNPFLAAQILYVFGLDTKVDWCTLETIDTVFCWLAYLQCCLNPFFYSFRKKYFRKLFEKVVRRE